MYFKPMGALHELYPLLIPVLFLRRRWLRSRFAYFLKTMRPVQGCRILDLGGGTGGFLYSRRQACFERGFHITVADIDENALQTARRRGFETLQMDENSLEQIPAGSSDIVFCNSVIEHVTIDKHEIWECVDETRFASLARRHQMRFARDIRRIGRGYFVQTPHRNFPVESHTWLPLSPRLSRRALINRLRFFNRWWVKKSSPDFHLLTDKDMAAYFPDASRVVVRTWIFLQKEIIAYKPPG